MDDAGTGAGSHGDSGATTTRPDGGTSATPASGSSGGCSMTGAGSSTGGLAFLAGLGIAIAAVVRSRTRNTKR